MPRERPEPKHPATSFAAERSLLIQFWRRYRRVIGEEERQGTLGIEWCGVGLTTKGNRLQDVCDDTAKNRRTRVAKNWHAGDTQEGQQGQRQRQYTIEEDLMDRPDPFDFPPCAKLIKHAQRRRTTSRRLRANARLTKYATTLVRKQFTQARKHAIGIDMLGAIFAAFSTYYVASMSTPAPAGVPLQAE